MNRYLFLLIFFNVFLYAQPFQIGTTTIDFVDSSRNNRLINTRIYYPANTNGTNVPVTNLTNDLFPVLTFGHGFVMVWSAYQNIWEALVPQGYILAFPTTEGGFSPSHLEFAKDLAFVNSQMKLLNNNTQSLFYNRISSKSGVMGHSMGGGCAHLAASLSTDIDAILTLAPAETNPSAISASLNINIPALIVAGANDCVTPPQNHQVSIYNAINNSPCKSFISIIGGSHCQMANSNFNCNFGESTCSPQPTISRQIQHQILNQFALLWLDGFLKDNCESHLSFLQNMASSTTINYQNSCNPCELSQNFIDKENIYLYPIPSNDVIHFNSALPIDDVLLFDLNGQMIKVDYNNNLIYIKNLPNGVYFIKVFSRSKQVTTQKIIKF